MLTLRRTEHEQRIEIMPLIDVIFLLLTFFIYAMVLMIRAELVPMELREYAAGEQAAAAPAVTISLDRAGDLFIDREPITIEAIIPRLQQITAEQPDTVIYLAADAQGDTDRLPVFLELYDRLAIAGIDVKLVGRPSEGG